MLGLVSSRALAMRPRCELRTTHLGGHEAGHPDDACGPTHLMLERTSLLTDGFARANRCCHRVGPKPIPQGECCHRLAAEQLEVHAEARPECWGLSMACRCRRLTPPAHHIQHPTLRSGAARLGSTTTLPGRSSTRHGARIGFRRRPARTHDCQRRGGKDTAEHTPNVAKHTVKQTSHAHAG